MAKQRGSDWPGSAQVYRRTRVRKAGARVEAAVMLGITGLSRKRAGTKALLGVIHGHRGITDGRQGYGDGTLREDACQIYEGSGPQVMAGLRNMAVFLFERMGDESAAVVTRHHVSRPGKRR